MSYKYEVEIELLTEFHTTDGSLAGLFGFIDEYCYSQLTRFCELEKLMILRDKARSTINFLARRFDSKGEAVVFMPGSLVKGVFRHAVDLLSIREVHQREGDALAQLFDELHRALKKYVVPQDLEKAVLHAAFVSETSWLLASWGDVAVEGVAVGELRAVKARRRVAEVVESILKGLGLERPLYHSHYLGLADVVFGVTGLRSAVRFSDFLLVEGESYVKTFIAVARGGRVANPFKVEVLPPGAKFRGRIEVVGNALASHEDVEKALCLAVSAINEGLIGFGKRQSAGFGRARVTMRQAC